METTRPNDLFLKPPLELLASETSNSLTPHSFQAIGALLPALITVQCCGTMANVYINEYGCDFLKHSISELLEMGHKFYSSFFPPEEMKVINGRLEKMVKKKRTDKAISFFQRIKPNEASEYSWFFTTSQLSSFSQEKEIYFLHISLPVNKCSYMGKKLESLVEESLFIRENHLRFKSLSHREKEIMELISKGNSSRKIADFLCISIHTVNNHRKNIIYKVGKKNLRSFLKLNSIWQSSPF